MSEEASLKDVTVSPNPADPPKPQEQANTEPAKEAPKVELKDPTEQDALELGKLLMGSGYSKEQINQLLETPKALAGLQAVLNSGDGRQIVQLLRQSGNGSAADRMEETIAQYYVEQYGDKGGKQDGKTQDSELKAQVEQLRQEIDGYRTKQEQAEARAALASTMSRYNGRVDDFFSQDGLKKLGLTKMEQQGIRAMLDRELAQDPQAVERINRGNFVDVAPTFKRIAENWVADKKEAAEAEKRQREGVDENAHQTWPGAAEALNIPQSAFDSWDATEEAFAKQLSRTR
jgi:hypothetical protein